MTLPERALEVIKSQVGVTEHPKGSNSGPEVNTYLASVGLKPGYSWCMALVVWSYVQAGCKTIRKTGGVLDQWNKSIAYKVTDPQPGDIFILDYGKGLGHTGIIESVNGEILNTVEGNSNNDGSREGFAVVRHTRNKAKVKGYLRFTL